MSYRIVIVDDSGSDTARIEACVNAWAGQQREVVQIHSYGSAESFLFACSECPDVDILLLDIEMSGMNGVELAKKLRGRGVGCQIVFITGYPDFMAEGYEVSALHYLLKPVDPEKLCTVLDRAAQNLRKPSRMVVLSVDGISIRLPSDEILYVEAFSHNLSVVTATKTYTLRMPLSDMEKLLGEGFVRCHRSYLVGLHAISQITKSGLMLDNGQVLPLSRSAAQETHRAFVSYYRRDSHETL